MQKYIGKRLRAWRRGKRVGDENYNSTEAAQNMKEKKRKKGVKKRS